MSTPHEFESIRHNLCPFVTTRTINVGQDDPTTCVTKNREGNSFLIHKDNNTIVDSEAHGQQSIPYRVQLESEAFG